MEDSRYFDRPTAEEKVGRRVLVVGEFSVTAKGVIGRVIKADCLPGWPERWAVAVRWESERGSPPPNWFNRRNYERYFVEIAGGTGLWEPRSPERRAS